MTKQWTDADGPALVNITDTWFGRWCARHIFTNRQRPVPPRLSPNHPTASSRGLRILLADARQERDRAIAALQDEIADHERTKALYCLEATKRNLEATKKSLLTYRHEQNHPTNS